MRIIEYIKESIAPYFGEFKKSEKYINKKVNYKEVLLLFLSFSVIGTILSEFINPDDMFKLYNHNIFTIIISILMIILFTIILLFLSVSIQHLFLKLVGGKAKFTQTLKFSNSISIFPLIVFSILGLIPTFLIKDKLVSTIISSLILFLIIIFIIWSFVISVILFSKIHKISITKSLIALILPIVFLVIIGIILVIISLKLGLIKV